MPPPMFRSPWGICRGLNLKKEHPIVRVDRKYTLKDEYSDPKTPLLNAPLNSNGEPRRIKIDVAAAAKQGKKKQKEVSEESKKEKAQEMKD